jgi:hypothetical protein
MIAVNQTGVVSGNHIHTPTIEDQVARTYLENRFRIRPLGVVSKKLIGLRKIA